MSMVQQVTTKVPPSFDGRQSWFAYEEAVDDWCDITELDPDKRGPALRNRLTDDALVYKPLLDRDLLRDPATGVKYFKDQMRPHFVKGSQSVFLWRFFQLFKAHRGQQDLLRWIGRMSVMKKRIQDAWMDLYKSSDANAPAYQAYLGERVAEAAAEDPPRVLDPLDDDTITYYLDLYNNYYSQEHARKFPINDNLFSLILTVLADLNEQQRERMTSAMALKNYRIEAYTFDLVREVFIELFCMPKSSIDDPSLRTAIRHRSFCVIDDGTMDGTSGYWVEDDDTGEVGFLPEFEDVFWIFDETSEAWASHHFRGRKIRRGFSKGKGKGKGSKGRRRFKSRKGKGKGKYAYWGEEEEDEYSAWTRKRQRQRKRQGQRKRKRKRRRRRQRKRKG